MNWSPLEVCGGLGFIAAFISFWCLICYLLALLSGWRAIARRYRASDRPPGRSYYMQSGTMGMTRFSLCMTICCSNEGLYLAVHLPWRIGHPPLLIPWSEMTISDDDRWYLFNRSFGFGRAIGVGNPSITRIRLPRTIVETFPLDRSDDDPSV